MTLEEWVKGYSEIFASSSLYDSEQKLIVPTREELIESMGSFRRRIHEYWNQAIATKSHVRVVKNAAIYRGIHAVFGAFVGGNELIESEQKPHPKSVELALRRLNLGQKAIRAIVIGDSLTDLEMARNANLDSILYFPPENEAFYDLAKLREGSPTHIVTNLEEILDIIT